jgi:hypothetical protein
MHIVVVSTIKFVCGSIVIPVVLLVWGVLEVVEFFRKINKKEPRK